MTVHSVRKASSGGITLGLAPNTFSDWSGLMRVMRAAFAQNVGRIDPPSTVFSSSEQDLQDSAKRESLLLVYRGPSLIGCLFLRSTQDELFLRRFGILPAEQGAGLARRVLVAAEELARQKGLHRLALETRVELRSNQAKFQALGFQITGGRAHEGYDRVTTLRMEKDLHSARQREFRHSRG
ncbi:Acetyltransferase (GNAT) family protein [Falsiruegeria litorea R37]|uniref:Acetyltransferase (GNAT) family protein n=1 Tax=Falsiruegeria litorea R37 TaxID=1200284 RepID=A0A1Y5U0T4_9RHOB|nr:GNAT family N-acetyltransferase [Falsiruegeria litorea]SLN73384.1 Acetyltransferase (GNAT) family protein [Falsiruegeria litorea R37]